MDITPEVLNQKKEMNFTINSGIEYLFTWAKNNLLYILFLFVLCMVYIFNNHLALKLVREINLKAKELKELRWEYLTYKSDLMYKSKLTEVLPKAKEMGLEELKNPPFIINLNSKEYKRQE